MGEEAPPEAGQCDSVLVDLGAAHVAWDGRRGHGLLGSEKAVFCALSARDGLTWVLSVLVFSASENEDLFCYCLTLGETVNKAE